MGAQIADVVIPQLNLPVQFRRFYDVNTAELVYSVGCLIGATSGRSEAGVRIVAE
jgi:hypothetical protein